MDSSGSGTQDANREFAEAMRRAVPASPGQQQPMTPDGSRSSARIAAKRSGGGKDADSGTRRGSTDLRSILPDMGKEEDEGEDDDVPRVTRSAPASASKWGNGGHGGG